MTANERLARIKEIESELRRIDIRRDTFVCELEALRSLKSPNEKHESATLLSPAAKINLFLSLFRCREDVYPRFWENPKTGMKGYSPVCRNEWFRGVCEKPKVKCSECMHQAFPPLDEAAAKEHLTGKSVIGTYAIRGDNSCVFLAADFDGKGWNEDVLAYQKAARELGVDVAIERSRSGNGGHAWIFFNAPVSALMARRLGTLIVAKASTFHPSMSLASYDRFFPNQDILPAGGFGNLIALPLQAKAREHGNSVFIDEFLEPYHDQWEYLAACTRISPERLELLLDQAFPATPQQDEPGEFVSRFEDRVLDVIPSAVTKGVFTGRVLAIRHAQLEILTTGLPSCLVAAFKRLATLANPVFFEKQRLRFGTYNIPRYIFCGEMHSDRLILPRGVQAAVASLIRKAGGKIQIEDKRPIPCACEFEFHVQLSPDQKIAVDTMLEFEDGVLLAPPGAGKTVMGCAIVAERKVSTLILVHRKPLMEQWRSRLEQFLGLNKDEIGTLGGTPRNIVIGMVQTLAKSPNPEVLFAPFSQVIIDECHHVPAASFEAVMKACSARYLLGLTATPNRKDGLQKILFLQCGPIRHRMELEVDPDIARRVIVRDIHLGLPPEDLRMPVHQVWDMLANHEERNRLIAKDITDALAEARNCVVLSDRKEHLETLEKLVNEAIPCCIDRVLRIDGSLGKKTRAGILDRINKQVTAQQGFVLFATSSLIGEGFDLPELDTLFLTLPISFKGRLIQYAGRLHRKNEGKSEVRIYDYVEPEHPLTSHMHRKRMTSFHSMHYQLSVS